MELGILPDDRNYSQGEKYPLELTPKGKELYKVLKPILDDFDLSFPLGDDGIPTARMINNEAAYNEAVKKYISVNAEARKVVFKYF